MKTQSPISVPLPALSAVLSWFVPCCLVGGTSAAESPSTATCRAEAASRVPVLAIDTRERDPFGQLQVPVVAGPGSIISDPPFNLLPLMVGRIPIGLIDSARGCFTVSGRVISKGERIQLRWRMHRAELEVISIRAGEVEFMDVSNGRKASWRVMPLPAGVEPAGGSQARPPGMVDTQSAVEIQLDE